jgi:hypothetical protein
MTDANTCEQRFNFLEEQLGGESCCWPDGCYASLCECVMLLSFPGEGAAERCPCGESAAIRYAVHEYRHGRPGKHGSTT